MKPIRTSRFWSVRLLVITVLLVISAVPVATQNPEIGEYPSIINVAPYRPVTSNSVCGVNGAEDFCMYTQDSAASLAPNCIAAVCNNTCPHSSTSPAPIRLAALADSFGDGVSTEAGRPGSTGEALRFNSSFVRVAGALVPPISDGGFSFGAWIKQDAGNSG